MVVCERVAGGRWLWLSVRGWQVGCGCGGVREGGRWEWSVRGWQVGGGCGGV